VPSKLASFILTTFEILSNEHSCKMLISDEKHYNASSFEE